MYLKIALMVNNTGDFPPLKDMLEVVITGSNREELKVRALKLIDIYCEEAEKEDSSQ